MARVRITMHHAQIERFLHAPDQPIHQEVSSRVRKTGAIAKATSRVDTGRMKNSEIEGVRDEGSRLVGFVQFTVFYAIYQIKGTGIYGPRHKRITSKSGKPLAFRVGGKLVFAKSVSGVKPDSFLVDALKLGAAPWPVTEH